MCPRRAFLTELTPGSAESKHFFFANFTTTIKIKLTVDLLESVCAICCTLFSSSLGIRCELSISISFDLGRCLCVGSCSSLGSSSGSSSPSIRTTARIPSYTFRRRNRWWRRLFVLATSPEITDFLELFLILQMGGEAVLASRLEMEDEPHIERGMPAPNPNPNPNPNLILRGGCLLRQAFGRGLRSTFAECPILSS